MRTCAGKSGDDVKTGAPPVHPRRIRKTRCRAKSTGTGVLYLRDSAAFQGVYETLSLRSRLVGHCCVSQFTARNTLT